MRIPFRTRTFWAAGRHVVRPASLLACLLSSLISGMPAAAAPGTLQFARISYSVGEDSGEVVVEVTRNDGDTGNVSVDYSALGQSATLDEDFRAADGTLDWADGDMEMKSFSVTLLDDDVWESTESIKLLLSNPGGGAQLGTIDESLILVTDNDRELPDPGSVQFAMTNFPVNESSGTATVIVTRTGGRDGLATVEYLTRPDTAGADADYEPASGRLVWEDGDETQRTFEVKILDDRLAEPVEGLRLVLENPAGTVLGSIPEAVITIHDDEVITTGESGVLKFAAPAYRGAEGDEIIEIEVERVDGNDGAVSVTLNSESPDNTAVSEWDYRLLNGTLLWGHGDAEPKIVYISVLEDNLVEDDEVIYLSLDEARGVGLAQPDTTIVTIGDNDIPPPPDIIAEYDEATRTVTAPRIDAGEWGVYSATLLLVTTRPDILLEVRTVEFLALQAAHPDDIQFDPDTGLAYVPAIEVDDTLYTIDLVVVEPAQHSWRFKVTRIRPYGAR